MDTKLSTSTSKREIRSGRPRVRDILGETPPSADTVRDPSAHEVVGTAEKHMPKQSRSTEQRRSTTCTPHQSEERRWKRRAIEPMPPACGMPQTSAQSIRKTVEAFDGCLSRMMGNYHVRFFERKGPQEASRGRHP